MRVHSHGRLTKRGVQHHVRGFAPNPWQGFQGFPSGWHLRVILFDQDAARLDDVFCLGIEEVDGVDIRLELFNAQARIASGVLATGNSLAVALLTPTSVAWADSSTAISSSKGEL